MNKKIMITILLFVLLSTAAVAELKAFPSAEGFGKDATGGRGGGIVEVTSLDCTGPGTLYDALRKTGKRTIIFKVGGTIRCTGGTYLSIPSGSGSVTIAGETAPGDGITLRGAELRIEDGNVILRHMRFRQDATTSTGSNLDSLKIKPGTTKDIIIDHVSVSYGIDEALSVSGTTNTAFPSGVTIQNSLIYQTDKNFLIQRAKDVSVLNNIFALANQRNIRANTISHGQLTFEMINNLVYGVNYFTQPSDGLKVTVENNIYEDSNEFTSIATTVVSTPAVDVNNNEPQQMSQTYLYVKGNQYSGAATIEYESHMSGYLHSTPYYRSSYVPKSTSGLKETLLKTAGAYAGLPQGRDSPDQTLINHIKAKTGKISYTGSYGTIQGGAAYIDTDKDGIADNWEFNIGGTVGKADNNGDHDGDGYTNLEEYLHFLAGEPHLTGAVVTTTTNSNTQTSSTIQVSNFDILELGADGFVVGWNTNVPTTGQVLYGTSGGLGKGTSIQTARSTEHQIQVSSLEAGTVYFFRVSGSDINGNTYNSIISLTRTYGASVSSTTSGTSGTTTSNNQNTNTNTVNNLGFITGVYLIDANANKRIRKLNDGETINLNQIGYAISLEAEVNSKVESVRFYDGSTLEKTEINSPYVIRGDNLLGNIASWTPTLKTYNFNIKAYADDKQTLIEI